MPKEGQDNETTARLANDPTTGRMDREANAAALDVIDDFNAKHGDDNFQPRQQPKGEDDVTERSPPQPRVDNKRNDIISRFRTNRTENMTANVDTVDDFTRSGAPPEFEQFREPEDDAPERTRAAQQEPEPEAPPVRDKVKLRVNHQDLELAMEDVIAHAQKSLAADDILGNAKTKARELDDILSNARNRAVRPGPDADHQTGADRSQQPAQNESTDQEQHAEPTSDGDDYSKLVETIQYGDPDDAKTLLKDTIDRAAERSADRVVTNKLQQSRMSDEAARTGKVLHDFNEGHPELLKDPYAQSVMKQHVYQAQVKDLTELGVTMEALAASIGHNPTPGDISNAHQFYRAEGYKLKRPEQMLNDAHDHLHEWRGTKKTDGQRQPANDGTKAAPRIAVNVDREQRRQAITPAPSRTAPPQQQRQSAPQRRDPSEQRASVVQMMQQKRNLARGRA